MSQIKFDKPLQISLIFSQQHKLFLFIIHLLAAILLLLPFDFHLALRLLLIAYVSLSCYFTYTNTSCRYEGELRYTENNNWLWINENKEKRMAMQNGTILHPQFLILNFINEEGRAYNWILFPDSIDKETFRKIRIVIRHSTAETISPPV